MSDTRKIVVCILSSLTLCAGAKAIVADSSANPYQGIVDRNVFGLKPPTPVSKGPDTEHPPPPKITLTGITTIFHDKRALMNVAMPARPPEPAKQQSFILAEHQREGDIEVLEIDVKTGDVKVSNFGTVVTLNLEKDGAKLPNTPALPLAGAQPNPAGYVPPVNPAGPPPGMKTIPTRQLRLPQSGDAAAPSAGNLAGAAQPNYGASSGFGGSQGFAAPPVQAQPRIASQQQLSLEEQTILLEANHEIAKASGDPSAMIFPPTELNPTRNTSEGQPGANPLPGNPNLPRFPQ